MKQPDGEKPKKPPAEKSAGDVLFLRKPAKPNPPLDVEWFYDEEEFFAEWMDEFDW